MTLTSVDIIIPIWNNPTEARACIVSIINSAPSARLIIVNNSSDRITELMLEEFSDVLGNRAIYMTMERNIGFVPAVNRALIRSDADWAIIIRPNATLSPTCFQKITSQTAVEQAGIITPNCPADFKMPEHLTKKSCTVIETCEIGFSILTLSKKLREQIGNFNEEMDGGIWCLRDYQHKTGAAGFKTLLIPDAAVNATPAVIFGSVERRRRIDEASIAIFRKNWGDQHHFAVYLPKDSNEANIVTTMELLLAVARKGHRLELFLHRSQYNIALKKRFTCLHCGIILHRLALFTPLKSLAKGIKQLKTFVPGLEIVCGMDNADFPVFDGALPLNTLKRLIGLDGGC